MMKISMALLAILSLASCSSPNVADMDSDGTRGYFERGRTDSWYLSESVCAKELADRTPKVTEVSSANFIYGDCSIVMNDGKTLDITNDVFGVVVSGKERRVGGKISDFSKKMPNTNLDGRYSVKAVIDGVDGVLKSEYGIDIQSFREKDSLLKSDSTQKRSLVSNGFERISEVNVQSRTVWELSCKTLLKKHGLTHVLSDTSCTGRGRDGLMFDKNKESGTLRDRLILGIFNKTVNPNNIESKAEEYAKGL